jgi:peptidoglycan/xylan/chitin deacetylase (PgdA/CDA1 family)
MIGKEIIAAGLHHTRFLDALKLYSHRYELVSNVGERRKLRRVMSSKYLILTYHTIGNKGAPWYCHISAAAFRKQMEYVVKHFRVVSLEQMLQELESDVDYSQAIVVTFDDGYVGTYTEAFPILLEYKIPATVYLTAGAIDTGELLWYDRIFQCFQIAPIDLTLRLAITRQFKLDSHNSRIAAAEEAVTYLRSLPNDDRQAWCAEFERIVPLQKSMLGGAMLSWPQVRRMHEAGIQFGAHTMTHPAISRLDLDTMREEIGDSRALIEANLGAAVEHFAFPFGKPRDCGTDATKLLKTMGFRTAATAITGLNQRGADFLRLRRLMVGDHLSIAMFALQLHILFFQTRDEDPEQYTDEDQKIEHTCAII